MGLFLTFEGPEGCGKSTQLRLLADHLAAIGSPFILTREPGGTPFGDKIRHLLLDINDGHLQPETEAFLLLAQRSEHLSKVIRPALASGRHVLCDRYVDSSFAYQGCGRGLGIELIRSLHDSTLGNYLPDLTILLDLDPRIGLERARHGGRKSFDRMESEDLSFHDKVRKAYLELAQLERSRFILVDATPPIDKVFDVLLQSLKERVPKLFQGAVG